MSDIFALEKLIIYPYWKQENFDIKNYKKSKTSEVLLKVSGGNYVEALKDEESQRAFTFISDSRPNTSSIDEFYKQNFLAYLEAGDKQAEEVLFGIGISCLQLFVQNNFCGPLIGPPAHALIPSLIPSNKDETDTRKCALKELFIDIDTLHTKVAQPELLIIARIVFYDIRENLRSFVTVNWWCFRYCIVHKKIFDGSSETLSDVMLKNEKLEDVMLKRLEEAEKSKIISEEDRDICAFFYLEAGHLYFYCYNRKKVEEYMNKALNVLGMDVNLIKAVGARSECQEKKVAQLVAKVSYTSKYVTNDEKRESFLLSTDLPKDVLIDDDRIKFVENDEDIIPNLRPLEQMVLFGQFLAQSDRRTEQSRAYLTSILQFPKNWSLQLSALFERSEIESRETLTMERSLVQLEELVKSVEFEEPSGFERLKLIYSSSFLTHWNVRKKLLNMLEKLGKISEALNVYHRILQYEEKHVAIYILKTIVYAILNDKQDPEGKPLKVLYKKCLELVSRLSQEFSTDPELCFLYAELTYSNPEGNHESKYASIQLYSKAIAIETKNPGWDIDLDVVQSVDGKASKFVQVVKEVTNLTDSKVPLTDLVSVRSVMSFIVRLIKNDQMRVSSEELTNMIREDLENRITYLTSLIKR